MPTTYLLAYVYKKYPSYASCDHPR